MDAGVRVEPRTQERVSQSPAPVAPGRAMIDEEVRDADVGEGVPR